MQEPNPLWLDLWRDRQEWRKEERRAETLFLFEAVALAALAALAILAVAQLLAW